MTGSPALDPVSLGTLRRLALCLVLIGLWCGAVHLATGAAVTPAPLLVVAGGTAMGTAAIGRERLRAPELNHWDEGIAYLGLASLSRAVTALLA
ncbi:hypothetical protein [Muricoccus radiodurans]|uniref:hypothetical protein n=1 Tax=Muricoccus radiodurans TaxID=2231721 RepID=UPI003CF8EF14